jgi:hypothetical protein
MNKRNVYVWFRRPLRYWWVFVVVGVVVGMSGIVHEPPEHHLKSRAAQFQLEVLHQKILEFKLKNARYPNQAEIADVLVIASKSRANELDPWSNRFIYRVTSDGYELYSSGKNGQDDFKQGDDVVDRIDTRDVK